VIYRSVFCEYYQLSLEQNTFNQTVNHAHYVTAHIKHEYNVVLRAADSLLELKQFHLISVFLQVFSVFVHHIYITVVDDGLVYSAV
jgi:hypothetical protein